MLSGAQNKTKSVRSCSDIFVRGLKVQLRKKTEYGNPFLRKRYEKHVEKKRSSRISADLSFPSKTLCKAFCFPESTAQKGVKTKVSQPFFPSPPPFLCKTVYAWAICGNNKKGILCNCALCKPTAHPTRGFPKNVT